MPELPAKIERHTNAAQRQARELSSQEATDIWEDLTHLQQKWVQEYLENGLNATQAAKDAGYDAGSDRNYRLQGYQNRHHPAISRLLEIVWDSHMPEGEAIRRMAQIARTDISDFLDLTGEEPEWDLEKAKRRGVLHLVKSFEKRPIMSEGVVVGHHFKVELHDKQKALDKILKVHGSYKAPERQDDQTINIFQQINADLRESADSDPPENPDEIGAGPVRLGDGDA